MKIPFFNKTRMLSDERIAPFYLDKAIDCDSGSSLDRAIAHAFPHQKIFARQLMNGEFESELKGDIVVGSKKEVAAFLDRESITKNARIVYVVSLQKGIRFKDFIFVFDASLDSCDADDWFINKVRIAEKKIRHLLK